MLSNEELGLYLKSVRESLEYSTHDVNKLCDISQSYISLMENGKRKPSPIILKKLSSIYNIDYYDLCEKAGYEYLINKDAVPVSDNFNNIPVVGKISAGQPILADEHIEGYLPVDPNIYGLTTSDDLFYLRVAGNSMNLKVKNGDYALIHKQNYAENGDIIVAIVNGDDEATLKKYKQINNSLIALEPMSDDPSYEPIYIDKKTNFQIIGKAIGYFGKI